MSTIFEIPLRVPESTELASVASGRPSTKNADADDVDECDNEATAPMHRDSSEGNLDGIFPGHPLS